MGTAITALFELIKQIFGNKQTEMEHKPTLDIVKDKRQYKKATDLAELIIQITDKYKDTFTSSDLKKYEKLKKKFLKVN